MNRQVVFFGKGGKSKNQSPGEKPKLVKKPRQGHASDHGKGPT